MAGLFVSGQKRAANMIFVFLKKAKCIYILIYLPKQTLVIRVLANITAIVNCHTNTVRKNL